jgi:hypothetical protein
VARRYGIDRRVLRRWIAATPAAYPIVEGGHRVVFLSSDDEGATAPVKALAKQLGSHPESTRRDRLS